MSSTAELEHLLRDTDAEIARLSRSMNDADGVSTINMMSLAKRRERLEEQLERESHRPQEFSFRRFIDASAYAPTMAAAGIATVALSAFAAPPAWVVAIAALQIGLSSVFMLKKGSIAEHRAQVERSDKDPQRS
jgi:hypothetical protein